MANSACKLSASHHCKPGRLSSLVLSRYQDAIKCSKDSTLLSISHCMTYNSTRHRRHRSLSMSLRLSSHLPPKWSFFLPTTKPHLQPDQLRMWIDSQKRSVVWVVWGWFWSSTLLLHTGVQKVLGAWFWVASVYHPYSYTKYSFYIIVFFSISVLLLHHYNIMHSYSFATSQCTPFIYSLTFFVGEIGGFAHLLLKVILSLCGVWKFRLFLSHSWSFLHKPKYEEPTCICTGIHWGLLSSDSHTHHIHLC